MMILLSVAMTGFEKHCRTSAYLQWLFHSGVQSAARGPLVLLMGSGVDLLQHYQGKDKLYNKTFIDF